ncbi:EFR1 family ferrodoxin [Intestinibacter sp.]
MKSKVPMFLVKLCKPIYDRARKTDHLHVNDDCISCGLCAKNCPVSAIEIKDGKPVWIKEQCVMCLKCLHCCPKFAIQYDNKTKKHRQYVHPKFKPSK